MYMKVAALTFVLTVIAGILAFGNVIPEEGPASNTAAILFMLFLIASIILGGLGLVPRDTDRGGGQLAG